MTQAQLGAAISLSRASVANIESGRQQVLVHTLFDIAAALEIDVTDLLPKAEHDHVDSLGQIPQDVNKTERDWIASLTRGKRIRG